MELQPAWLRARVRCVSSCPSHGGSARCAGPGRRSPARQVRPVAGRQPVGAAAGSVACDVPSAVRAELSAAVGGVGARGRLDRRRRDLAGKMHDRIGRRRPFPRKVTTDPTDLGLIAAIDRFLTASTP